MAETELISSSIQVVVFLPAYNEEEKIADVIKTVSSLYANSADRGFTVKTLLVDDGCSDKTVDIAQNAGVSRVVHHPKNMGLGAATRTGMRVAYEMGCDIAVKLDADFQHDPKDIEACIQPIIRDEADLVWGSRFSGSILYKMPMYRYVGNRVFTYLMNRLTDFEITDAQTGLMCFNRRYLSVFQILKDYNPPQQILLDANIKHMRFTEVPVVFRPRTTGHSFISYKYPIKVLSALLLILIYANPFKVFSIISAFMFLVAFAVAGYNIWEYVVGRETSIFVNYATIILFTLAGLQMFSLGVLADMVMRRTRSDNL